MQYRETKSIREMVRLTLIATLALFFIAETMLTQDVMVVRPVVAVISGIAVILWYWGQDR
jgi:Flp pilus assembly protein TadB